MRFLITGICGFVGSELACALQDQDPTLKIVGIDNLSRPGSWTHRERLTRRGIRVVHGDIRCAADLESIEPCDWIIDAAANASVLAGVGGGSSSRQLVDNNLSSTINLLECCKSWKAGFILLSTSRVYSIAALAPIPVEVKSGAFSPVIPSASPASSHLPESQASQFQLSAFPVSAFSAQGIRETFSTAAPVSLYGATKLTSEILALEYGAAFDFPVWINRCGVMAGAGQFGRPDQGIFAFWLHSWREKRPLKYIGFDGLGHQVRDCLHPRDLVPLLVKQMGGGKVESRDEGSETDSRRLPEGKRSALKQSRAQRDRQPQAARREAKRIKADIRTSDSPQIVASDQRPEFQLSAFPVSAFESPPRIVNVSGGLESSRSLAQLSDWCSARWGSHPVSSAPEPRPYDLPWVVLDSTLAAQTWDWRPQTPVEAILTEIADFADAHPDWIKVSA
jgi:CDP-paratose 2-epimerase